MKKGSAGMPTPLNFEFFGSALLRGLRHWQHGNKRAALETLVEFDGALFGRKDCVVFAHTNARARPKLRAALTYDCLLYTSPSPRDLSTSRMPSSA